MKLTDKPIILIKIGGSLITNKEKPFSLDKKNLGFLCQEIKKATKLKKNLIIGHGSGSFAHWPAKKYKTNQGIINKNSLWGAAKVAEAAACLNQIFIQELLKNKVKAVSISPASMIMAKNNKLKSIFLEPIEKSLSLGLVPIVYGDLIFDQKTGCTIFSTEKILNYLALELRKKGYSIEKIIYCSKSQGVYDQKEKNIPLLTNKNFKKYKKALQKAKGIDITGGMIHKVEEIFTLVKKGVPGLIIDGREKNNLSRAIAGKKIIGTKVSWTTK